MSPTIQQHMEQSLAGMCRRHPERVRRLLRSLNPGLPGLAAVRQAVAAEDWTEACAALLEYYRTCDSGQWLRHAEVPPGNGSDPAADKAAQARFPLPGGAEKTIPRRPDGGFDWGHVPPVDGGDGWTCGINRHDYMLELLAAFYATGNRAYVRALDEQLHDWCSQVKRPDKPGNDYPWGTILEPGHRAKVWPAVFYGLQPEAEFAPATRILMLCQALEHAEFLYEFHAGGSNWIITEMAGLFSIACAWPEFREGAAWRDTALRMMQSEVIEQVYPDGVQKELSSNYQAAVLWHIGHFTATARGAGVALEPAFTDTLERMWNYIAYSLGPNGFSPHNGDSDRVRPEAHSQAIQPLQAAGPLLEAAALYHRPDWTYIATNGATGVRPEGLPSAIFPWAGQLVTRSGWDADAHWGFFDAGPWGILHQHNDALHLSVTAFGRDLLVDSGRYTYENYLAEAGTWRSYFVNSAAHNVILVDGLVQADGAPLAQVPLDDGHAYCTPEYDFAMATFSGGFTDVATASARLKAYLWRQGTSPEADRGVKHTRALLYVRGAFWVVVDRIETDRPRKLTALWHFHPDCTVVRDGSDVVTVDEGVGNLRIQPVGPVDWEIELVRGREGPDFQGWYSPEMDVRVPATCACHSATIARTATFAWILIPAKGDVHRLPATWGDAPDDTVQIKLHGDQSCPLEIAVRLNDGQNAVSMKEDNP